MQLQHRIRFIITIFFIAFTYIVTIKFWFHFTPSLCYVVYFFPMMGVFPVWTIFIEIGDEKQIVHLAREPERSRQRLPTNRWITATDTTCAKEESNTSRGVARKSAQFRKRSGTILWFNPVDAWRLRSRTGTAMETRDTSLARYTGLHSSRWISPRISPTW